MWEKLTQFDLLTADSLMRGQLAVRGICEETCHSLDVKAAVRELDMRATVTAWCQWIMMTLYIAACAWCQNSWCQNSRTLDLDARVACKVLDARQVDSNARSDDDWWQNGWCLMPELLKLDAKNANTWGQNSWCLMSRHHQESSSWWSTLERFSIEPNCGYYTYIDILLI